MSSTHIIVAVPAVLQTMSNLTLSGSLTMGYICFILLFSVVILIIHILLKHRTMLSPYHHYYFHFSKDVSVRSVLAHGGHVV